MTDEKRARLLAYGNTIARYSRLLRTTLSELERSFIERRLAEEEKAIALIRSGDPLPTRMAIPAREEREFA